MMIRNSIKMALLSAAALAVAGAIAAGGPAASKPGKGDMPMQQGMMGSDGPMDGASMMGMMRSCQSMMGGAGTAGGPAAMPKLPPGNEKLELQMQAEMMQKMGEIAARYADKIKESR